MGLDGDLYRAVLLVHILTVIVGFGPLVLNGLYGVRAAKLDRRSAAAVTEVNFSVSQVAARVVYLVFITGVLVVLFSDDTYDLGDLWVSASMVTYVAAIGISHGMLVPNARRMMALQKELADLDGAQLDGPPEQAVELADRAKRAAAMGTVLNLLLVFILYLMVFKPGL
jgi:hypothetical protein